MKAVRIEDICQHLSYPLPSVKNYKEEKNMEKTFDLTPIYAKALAEAHKIKDDITTYYGEKELLYYDAARKSIYFSCSFGKKGSILNDELFLKALGIIEVTKQETKDGEEAREIIYKLFKKGYHSCYIFFRRYDFDYDPFLKDCMGEWNKLSDREFFGLMTAVIFFNNNERIFEDPFLGEFLQTMETLLIRTPEALDLTQLPKNFSKRLFQIRSQFPKDFLDILSKSNYNKKKLEKMFPEYDDIVFRQAELLGEYCGLDPQILMENLLNSDDLNMVIYVYICMFEKKEKDDSYNNRKITYTDAKILYCLLLLLGAFKSYTQVKEYHKENSYQKNLLELVEYKKQLEKANKGLAAMERHLKIERVAQTDIENLKTENEYLKKQIEKMQVQLEEANNSNEELYKLREFVYHSTSETTTNEKVEDPFVLEELNKTKGYIIRGHPNWVKKIRLSLPNWNFVSPDVSTFDTSKLKGSVVIINTSFLKHSLYSPIIKTLRKEHIPFGYINDTTNIFKSLQEIFEIIKG